jgi:hypothetical protein
VRSITEQCLKRMIVDRQASLRGESVVGTDGADGGQSGSVRKRERLCGTLNYYFRLAG